MYGILKRALPTVQAQTALYFKIIPQIHMYFKEEFQC